MTINLFWYIENQEGDNMTIKNFLYNFQITDKIKIANVSMMGVFGYDDTICLCINWKTTKCY